jgi:hypothetical protein
MTQQGRFGLDLQAEVSSGHYRPSGRPDGCSGGPSARSSSARGACRGLRAAGPRGRRRKPGASANAPAKSPSSPAAAARAATILASARSESVGPRCPWRSIRRDAPLTHRRLEPTAQRADRTRRFFQTGPPHARAGPVAVGLRAPDRQHDPWGRSRGRRPQAQPARRGTPSLQREALSRTNGRHTRK